MDDSKKPRKDSKLDNMPESRVLELRDMMLANKGHAEIHSWLAAECGVSCSSSAFTTFYQRHCVPIIRDKRRLSVLKSEAVGDAMAKEPAKWDAAIIEKVKQRVFEFLDADDAKPAELMLVVDAVTKANKEKREDKKVDQSERRLRLIEAEAQRKAAAEAAIKKVQGDPTLTEDQRREAIIENMDVFFGLKKAAKA